MASRGKRKDKEGFARDEDAEAHAPAKKAAKSADSSDESDDIVVCNASLPAWISGNLSGRGHAEEIDKAMADLS